MPCFSRIHVQSYFNFSNKWYDRRQSLDSRFKLTPYGFFFGGADFLFSLKKHNMFYHIQWVYD